jgi:hypothetical protein
MEKNNEVKEAASKYSLQSLEAMEEDIRGFRYKPFSFVKESIMDWTALDFEAGVTWQKEKDKAEYDKLKEDNALLLDALKGLYEFNLGKPDYLDTLLNNAESAIKKAESK